MSSALKYNFIWLYQKPFMFLVNLLATPVVIGWNVTCAKPTTNVLYLELTASYNKPFQCWVWPFCSKGLDIPSKAIKLECVIMWKSVLKFGTFLKQ